MPTRTHTIYDFMSPEPTGIDRSLTLADAAERMRLHQIGYLLVLDGVRLVGVIR